jgi:hypothetical protein
MSLVIRAIMYAKFLMKNLYNWAIMLNTWICCGFTSTCIWTMVWIFLGFGNLLLKKIIKPSIILENTIKAHLFGFKLIPNFVNFLKHNLNFYIWVPYHYS